MPNAIRKRHGSWNSNCSARFATTRCSTTSGCPCVGSSTVAPDRIPDIYRAGDIVVSPSHFETLPTTLVEGLAAGCLAVAFDRGGQRDIITHLKNGYLAEYPDASALADGLLWAASCNPDRKSLHDDVASRFSEKAVAEAYTELFTQLLKK